MKYLRHTTVLSILVLAGCMWHPFGTPITKAEKLEKKIGVSANALLQKGQEAVYKADFSLADAPAGRSVDLAQGFVTDARQSLDQALGTPVAGDVDHWRDLVARLKSENQAIRAKAEADNNKAQGELARVSHALAAERGELVKANVKLRDYAADGAYWADKAHTFILVLMVLAFIWVAGQVLGLVAKFNPAFLPASLAVNGVLAPVSHWTKNEFSTLKAKLETPVNPPA